MSEKAFMRNVTQLAKLYGWLVFHPYYSRKSTPGWPDLVLIKPPVALFVELKSWSGRTTPQQKQWLAALTACGLDARLWRPGDWEEIKDTLTGDA